MGDLAKLEARVKDIEDRERKMFRAGVVVLGGIVLSLVAYIWNIKVGFG